MQAKKRDTTATTEDVTDPKKFRPSWFLPKETVEYEHHGALVHVSPQLKGKHREHCLCYGCARFDPEDGDNNCPIAAELFSVCVKHDLVTPVYECPEFVPAEVD